jgi:hypothetical protein
MPLFNDVPPQEIITSASVPSNPTQGLIWNELDSSNNLIEVWGYINGFWWSQEKVFNVFTPTNNSGFNYYLATNPTYNYFVKSAHLLFQVGAAASYSSVFNFLFQHNKGGGFISTPFTESFNITASDTFANIFSVKTKIISTIDANQNLRFLLIRASGSNVIIPSLAIFYHLIRK